MNFTNEQKLIFNSKSNEYTFIQAYAGSGKTTTIENYVNFCDEKNKVLYLTFNTSLISCKNPRIDYFTIHGFAYNFLNIDSNTIKNLSLKDLQNIYSIDHYYANTILNSYNFFLASTSKIPKLKHVYLSDNDGIKDHKKILNYMKDLWNKMNNNESKICHDYYLKMFMINNPILDYDIILIDECQDITPCIMKILYRQKCRKVFVGDIYQQIYGFRNVLNPFNLNIKDRINFNLTLSFRFGNNLALLCNIFLNKFLKAEDTVKGCDNIDTKIYHYKYGKPKDYAYITRTNKEIIIKAYYLSKSKTNFTIIGKSYNFEKEIEIFSKIKQNDFSCLKYCVNSIDAAKEIFKNIQNYKWITRLELIESFEENIWELIKTFHIDDSSIKLLTSHQSKGLEFNNVVLANDFKPLIHLKTLTFNDYYKKDEYNLLYVAMTRAKMKLYLNKNLANFLVLNNDFNFNVVVLKFSVPCNNCGLYTHQQITHSTFNTPDFILPNNIVKINCCSNCIDANRNIIINNFKTYW